MAFAGGSYVSEAAAYMRVDALKDVGIWPGVYRDGQRWRLTFDPPLAAGLLDAHGYPWSKR